MIWISQIQRAFKKDISFALVSVLDTKGSTPCSVGDKLLCLYPSDQKTTQNLQTFGTIGGGTLEYRTCLQVKQSLQEFVEKDDQHDLSVHRFEVTKETGQCCGGTVNLLIELFSGRHSNKWIDALENCYAQKQDGIVLNVKTPTYTFKQFYAKQSLHHLDSLPEKLNIRTPAFEKINADYVQQQIAESPNRPYSPAYHYKDKNCEIILELYQFSKLFSVMLFGCGHIARALVPIIASLPVVVYWIDDRASEFDIFLKQYPGGFSNVHIFCQDFLSMKTPPQAYCLVITYSHAKDYAICKHLLLENEYCYLGLIGSTSKGNRFRNFLSKEKGMPIQRVDNLECPMNPVHKKIKSVPAIALSIAYRLLEKIETQL